MKEMAKIIGTGLATTGLIKAGIGIGIGVVFGCLILGVARNPSLRGQLSSYFRFCFFRSNRFICFNDGFFNFFHNCFNLIFIF